MTGRESLMDDRDLLTEDGACDRAAALYLLCPACGFFFGNVRLRPGQQAICHECGTEPLLAYDSIEKALARQEEIRG